MQIQETIAVREFCIHHKVELSFIYALKDYGFVEFYQKDEELFVPFEQLAHLERMVRMYYEMDINLEGIETIIHLLQRTTDMQQEITRLNNRLDFYENQ